MNSSWIIAFLLLVFSMPTACVNQQNQKPLMGGIRTQKSETTETKTDSVGFLPAPLTDRPEQILHREGYTASYNSDLRVSNWIAWHLTKKHTSGPYNRKGITFQADEEVSQPRAVTFDYVQTGYDRGHMCPSGDNKWSEKAQQESFLLTNICPQSHDLNSGDWNDLEMKCRDWARQYGDVYIVAGPVFRGQPQRRIGGDKIAVPDAFYKVILRMNNHPSALGFLYENEDGHHPMHTYVKTVDEIEALTGIDFFSSLPDDVEKAVESTSEFNKW